MSKADFILEQPADLSAGDVVKRAAQQGMKISAAYIHTVRSQARSAKSNGVSKRKRAATTTASTKRRAGDISQHEQHFLETVLVIGFENATQLLQDFRASCQRQLLELKR